MAGKHAGTTKRTKASVALMIVAAIALATAIGGTMAWLIDSSDEALTNTFTPATISGLIKESFDTPFTTKSNVYIENTSDVPVYVRVALVPTWVDSQQKPTAEPVAASDIIVDNTNWSSFEPATESGWIKGSDGYFYYTKPLNAANAENTSDETNLLFNSATVVDKVNYDMNLQILLQMIQAEPTNAVVEAWGVTVNGITISK